jgi:hypothetical protein
MDIIILAAWSIWNIRNNKIFKNQRPTFQSWKFLFHQELHMLQYRMKKKNVQFFKAWLQSQIKMIFFFDNSNKNDLDTRVREKMN